MNTGIESIGEDSQVQWLGGGYTIWARQILIENPQQEVRTRHAAGEDLMFSYPIGKKYSLYVCSGAHVTHHETISHNKEMISFRVEQSTVARLVFCQQHSEFSAILFLLSSVVYQFMILLIPGRMGLKEIEGFCKGVARFMRRADGSGEILEERTDSAT